MNVSHQELLARLGNGESIKQLCAAAGMTREAFDAWWRSECQRRVPPPHGRQVIDGVRATVRITRDKRGMPHIAAENDQDLFFGFGYSIAQDRLFQLDYTRRRARGRMAEILGKEALESDILYRTLDLSQIAAAEWESLDASTRALLTAYAAGINAVLAASRGCWPIEFDLLGYQPEAWTPQDSLVVMGEFRWYLTGRFPVIVIPELVKRAVGEGPLYEAFLSGEVDDECILPAASYPPQGSSHPRKGTGSGDAGPGSNNWVLSGARTESGQPLVASDPHVPFAAVSIWHEVHLRGGSFDVAGIALAGMPGVLIGRNKSMAWGVTNNICSQRDLYQERTDPKHPGCYLYEGQWKPAKRREEVIAVRGATPVQHTVTLSRNGPIVDRVLPSAARHTGPVSLRWLGAEPCGWLSAVLGMNRAKTATEFRDALRPWKVPTFNVVFADTDGHIGYQCAGRIPLRTVRERAYRPGWEQRHQWNGVLSDDDMPGVRDPDFGFLVTANNRVAPDDYVPPLSGTWVTGYRARRIREQIAARPRMKRDDHRQLQLDVHSGRAAACAPALVEMLSQDSDPRIQKAVEYLKAWDHHVRANSVAAALFNVFFVHWCRVVTAQRLPAEAVDLVSAAAGPLAVQLLQHDESGWFTRLDRAAAVRNAFDSALRELSDRLGADLEQWTWGRLHLLVQKHFLSGRGDLGQLLDHRRLELDGDGHTVNSSSPDVHHAAWLGAGYRFVADLADAEGGWWSIENGSASGHPGSPHYSDQLEPWHAGQLHYSRLNGEPEGQTLLLTPVR